jgi:hypothetical protein
LIHEATQSDFDHVPLWLSEGLATSVEHTFVPDPNAHSLLEAALRERGPISLSALCAAFPHDPASAHLAYAQSASVIDYIRDMYGRQALRDLIAAYADGATCEGGVRRVLGSSLDRTQTLWLAWVMSPNKWEAFWRDGAAWVILLALFACLPFLLMRSPRASAPVLGDQAH